MHVLIYNPAAESTFSVDNGSDVDGFRSSDVLVVLVVLEAPVVTMMLIYLLISNCIQKILHSYLN